MVRSIPHVHVGNKGVAMGGYLCGAFFASSEEGTQQTKMILKRLLQEQQGERKLNKYSPFSHPYILPTPPSTPLFSPPLPSPPYPLLSFPLLFPPLSSPSPLLYTLSFPSLGTRPSEKSKRGSGR